MSKFKYHERDDGTIDRCRAGEGAKKGTPKGCPFGISPENHIFASSLNEAKEKHEENLSSEKDTLVTQIKDKSDNEVYQEISRPLGRAMDVIGKLILSSERNSDNYLSSQKGRQTSTDFEKNIAIPVIEKNNKHILKFINSNSKKGSLRASDLHIPSDKDEKGRRSIGDFFVILKNPSDFTEIHIPVNIKYTKGEDKDNVMGKKAFLYMLGFDEKKGEFNEFVSDYYLLSFSHGKNRPTDSFTSISLLESDPFSDGYTFNNSQSFPLQGKASSVTMGDSNRALHIRRADWMDWYEQGLTEQLKKREAERNHYAGNSKKLRESL